MCPFPFTFDQISVMMRFFLYMIFSFSLISAKSHAAVVPGTDVPVPALSVENNIHPASLSVKQIENLLGRKLTLREKMSLKVVKLRLQNLTRKSGEPTPLQLKQGKVAAILGGAAVLLLLIGSISATASALVLLSLPLGIAALVLGIKSSRGNGNTLGVLGLVFGAAVTFLWLLAAIVVLLLISTWSW